MGRGPRHPNTPPADTGGPSDPLGSLAALLAPAPNTAYGTILSLGRDQRTDDLRLAMPSLLRDAGLGMIDLMRGTAGEAPRPMTDSDIPYADPRMTPNAMMAFGLLAAPVVAAEERGPMYLRSLLARDADSAMASANPRMYNPPTKSPRPFEADYPAGAPANASGQLTADIEGRPLGGASYIVGRRVVGGADVALPETQLDAVTKSLLGSGPQAVAARALPRGTVGAYRRSVVADMPARNISVGQWLPGPVAAKVVGHELGYAIDDLAGTIPTVGLNTELRSVYNDLNNPDLALARKRNPNIDPNATGSPPKLRNHGPEMLGYRGDAVQRELVAEALRAYMADPN